MIRNLLLSVMLIFALIVPAGAQTTPGQLPPVPTDMGDPSRCAGGTTVSYGNITASFGSYYVSTGDGGPGTTQLRLSPCTDQVAAAIAVAVQNRYTNCVVDVVTYPTSTSNNVRSIHDCVAPGAAPPIAPGTFNGALAQGIAQKYAPAVYLQPGESWLPSSIEYYAQFVHAECNGAVVAEDITQLTAANLPTGGGGPPPGSDDSQCFFTPKNGMDNPYDQPAWMHGQDPTTGNVPIYVNIYTDNRDPPSELNFIAQYMMFFPYNFGKNTCKGLAPNDNCLNGRLIMDDHVGDWEVVSIRFVDGMPKAIHVGAHGNDQPDTASTYFCCGWSPTGKVSPSLLSLRWIDTHPIVYAAEGSHGIWANPGRHNYLTIASGDKFNDYTNKGPLWQTWNKMVFFSYTPTPSIGLLLNGYNGRWGAHHMGLNACDISGMKGFCSIADIPGDEYQLNDGPTLPNRSRDREFLMATPPG